MHTGTYIIHNVSPALQGNTLEHSEHMHKCVNAAGREQGEAHVCTMVLTSYITSVQPSRVTHWNTVSMCRSVGMPQVGSRGRHTCAHGYLHHT